MGLLDALQSWMLRRRRHRALRKSVYYYGKAAEGFAERKNAKGLAEALEGVQRLTDCGFSDVERRARAILRKYSGLQF